MIKDSQFDGYCVTDERCKTAGGFHWNYVNGGRKYGENT